MTVNISEIDKDSLLKYPGDVTVIVHNGIVISYLNTFEQYNLFTALHIVGKNYYVTGTLVEFVYGYQKNEVTVELIPKENL